MGLKLRIKIKYTARISYHNTLMLSNKKILLEVVE